MVKAWKEKVIIPTYEVGKPEKNPIFLEKRVYQGSSGVVYPYPVIESISDKKTDKEYNAVYLENEYIKVMILPELGGRIQMAYDKIKQRHFIYYNHVIKPALVGLTGPWISGGIEFNWPQHHRPSTFLPVDTTIEENTDGSITVWVNEMERMFHQKGMAGITLHPGHAYIEIKGILYNRTEVPQTFLWWANPAVAVNDYYQSVFPQDVNAVFDHGKRAVSSFPIASGVYYKMDYSAGVDISNYKNIKVPTSYMAVNSKFDFVGGYENDIKAGMLHVANHHISPGKKQWTWGNGDFGRAWDRNLTDEDGPYIELMAGVFTENQPDFTWIQPYEEKSFIQYFLPYRELGAVKNASKDFLVNIEKTSNENIHFKICSTSKRTIDVVLKNDDNVIKYCKTVTVSPEKLFEDTVDINDLDIKHLYLNIYKGNTVSVVDNTKPILSWHAEPDEIKRIPYAAEAALYPEEIKTTEQLYLTGLHIEQYRHATYCATDYYEEALRRDPIDVRNNNALGLWYIRKGRFEKAEVYLRTAVKVLQKRNPNPYDGEPIYNLGLALKYQGRYDEAYDMFYKSCWNAAWQDAGYFACAQISMMQGRLDDALNEVDHSLIRNWHNHKARALKTSILRKMGKTEDALKLIEESLKLDKFNYGCMFEKLLLNKSTAEKFELSLKKEKTQDEKLMVELMHGEANNYDEIALDYCASGCYNEAKALWHIAIRENAVTPMTYYYLGWCHHCGSMNGADKIFIKASKVCSDYCFPNRLEAILSLQYAISLNINDAKAPYYLGLLYYDKRQYDLSQQLWELSAKRDAEFPTVWRNLSLIYFNKINDKEKAVKCMERAFKLDTTDSRILMELDQLYKRLQRPHKDRLDFINKYPSLIIQRDDLLLEKITLLNQIGEYQQAKELLDSHIFHPWEGGEGKVPAQYQISRIELAKNAIIDEHYYDAIKLLEECLEYPNNLGEGKLINAQENDFYYFMGCAYDAIGEKEKSRECWESAIKGPTEPATAMYYNDAKPDKIFYAGLALQKLGREDEACSCFYKLKNYGEQHIYDKIKMDYFAVSLPDLQIWEDSLDMRNMVHCLYMLALGYYGLDCKNEFCKYIDKAAKLDINNQGIQAMTLCRLI